MRQELFGQGVEVRGWPLNHRDPTTEELIETCLGNIERTARLEAQYRAVYEDPQTPLGSPKLFEAHHLMVRYKCEQAHWRKYVAELREKLRQEQQAKRAEEERRSALATQTAMMAPFLPAREVGADDGDEDPPPAPDDDSDDDERVSPWDDIGAGRGGR